MDYKYGEPLLRECKKCGNLVKVNDRHATCIICDECKSVLSEENLRDLAINKWYSVYKIAKELGFGKATIKRHLHKYNIFEEKTNIV